MSVLYPNQFQFNLFKTSNYTMYTRIQSDINHNFKSKTNKKLIRDILIVRVPAKQQQKYSPFISNFHELQAGCLQLVAEADISLRRAFRFGLSSPSSFSLFALCFSFPPDFAFRPLQVLNVSSLHGAHVQCLNQSLLRVPSWCTIPNFGLRCIHCCLEKTLFQWFTSLTRCTI